MLNFFDLARCQMSSCLFLLSIKKNYDSMKFIINVLSSRLGGYLYSDDCAEIWRGAEYVMESLEDEVAFEQGETLSEDFMEWAGYFYRYWSLKQNDTAKQILEYAPPSVLLQEYVGLHSISMDMAIENLKHPEKYPFGGAIPELHLFD